MTAAWTVAALSRAKALPKLDKFLGPDPTRRRRRKPVPMEIQKARMLSWARGAGVKAETTTEE